MRAQASRAWSAWRRSVRVGLGALAVLALAASSASADPAPFSSVSGTCSSNAGLNPFSAAAQTSDHRAVLVRLNTTGGPGAVDLGQNDPGHGVFPTPAARFTAADTIWFVGLPVAAGQGPAGFVDCSLAASGFAYSLSFFDVPRAPVSFSGASTFEAGGDFAHGIGSQSELRFVAPSRGQYVADVVLTRGAVELLFDQSLGPKVFNTSGALELGRLDQGIHILLVTPQPGPQAQWTVTFHVVPARVTGFAFQRRFVRPGHPVAASYTLSDDAIVTADIVDAGDHVVRELASQSSQGGGRHSVRWDGLDGGGKPVPDGSYRLRLTIEGAATPPPEAPITADSHGPAITFLSAAHLARDRPVVVQVKDVWSGVASGLLQVNGRTVAHLRPGSAKIVYLPAGGWRPGRYRLAIRAADRAGNVSITTRLLTIS
jgi:hypothetical protein